MDLKVGNFVGLKKIPSCGLTKLVDKEFYTSIYPINDEILKSIGIIVIFETATKIKKNKKHVLYKVLSQERPVFKNIGEEINFIAICYFNGSFYFVPMQFLEEI